MAASSRRRARLFTDDERETVLRAFYDNGRSLSAVAPVWRDHYGAMGPPPPDKVEAWRVVQRFERENGGPPANVNAIRRMRIGDAHAAAILKAYHEHPDYTVRQLIKVLPFKATAAAVETVLNSCDIGIHVDAMAEASYGSSEQAEKIAELEGAVETMRQQLQSAEQWLQKQVELYRKELRRRRLVNRLLSSKYDSLRRVAMKHHKRPVIARRYPKSKILESQATKRLPFEPDEEVHANGETFAMHSDLEMSALQRHAPGHVQYPAVEADESEFWAAEVKPDVVAVAESAASGRRRQPKRKSARLSSRGRQLAPAVPPAWAAENDDEGEDDAEYEEEPAFVCRKCNRNFTSKKRVNNHERKCEGPKPKPAPKKRPTPTEPSRPRCTLCGAQFNEKYALKVHVRSACEVLRARGAYDQHTCDTCNRTFANAARLQSHKRKAECAEMYSTNPRAGLLCFGCGNGQRVRGSRLDYVNHCNKVHGVPAKVENVTFDNEVQFENWKLRVEDEGNFRFNITTNVADWADPVIKSYRCTYSGPNIPTWRRPGAPPKNPARREYILVPKMGTECPAFLRCKIDKTTGKVEASFCLAHAGHTCDTVLKERFVAPQVEQYIADLLEGGHFAQYDVDGIVQAVIAAKDKLSNAAERINARTAKNVIAKVQKDDWKKRRRPVFFGPLYRNLVEDTIGAPSPSHSTPPTQVIQHSSTLQQDPQQQQQQLQRQPQQQQPPPPPQQQQQLPQIQQQGQQQQQPQVPNAVIQSAMSLYGW